MRLEIVCRDRLGIAQDVLDILVRHNIDLRGIEVDEVGKIFLNFPNIEFEQFTHLMPEIRKLQGVEDVKKISFMPIEREKKQFLALLDILPDPVLSIDNKGKILLANSSATASFQRGDRALIGADVIEFIKGFGFSRWLNDKEISIHTQRVRFDSQAYVAEMLPIIISESPNTSILAGAVIILKSEYRLGQQLQAFKYTQQDSFQHIQAASANMKRVLREAKKMAVLDAPMLIFGETGTGKEMLARACHQASPRKAGAFLALNCASIPDSVAETELFGHGSDALGAEKAKSGLFEQTIGGTVFLDEVGDMSLQLQAKLLRVLESGRFRRSGNEQELETDVRIMCATQKDLGQMVADGLFREDLYYRLNVLSLVLPALRERKPDIAPLAEAITRQHAIKLGRRPPKLQRSCLECLVNYHWPGNIRQLDNALYRAVSLLDDEELTKKHMQLPSGVGMTDNTTEDFSGTLEEEVKRFERDLLRRLYPSHPSTRQLAKKLGLSHTAIANKLREYGINRKTVKV